MLLTLTTENFNQLCKTLKTADIPRPVLTEKFSVLDETFYEIHIADMHVPALLKATMQQPEYNREVLHLLTHVNNLFV